MRKEILQFKNLSIGGASYGKIEQADLFIRRGECHAVAARDYSGQMLAELFQGKTQIIKGTVLVEERQILQNSRDIWGRHKVFYIGAVTTFLHSLNLAENLFLLRRNSLKKVRLNQKAIYHQAEQMLLKYGFQYDVKASVDTLGNVDRLYLSMIRMAQQGARLIVLNNVSYNCSAADRVKLKALIERLKSEGIAFLIIDNHLDVFYEQIDCLILMDKGYIIKKVYGNINLCRESDELLKRTIGNDSMAYEKNSEEKFTVPYNYNQLTVDNQISDNEKNSWHFTKISLNQDQDFHIDLTEGNIIFVANSNVAEQERLWSILSYAEDSKPVIIKNDKILACRNVNDLIRSKIALWGTKGESGHILYNLTIEDNILLPSLKKISSFGGFYQDKAKYIWGEELLFQNDFLEKKEARSQEDILQTIMYKWQLFHPGVLIIYNLLSSVDARMRGWLSEQLQLMAKRGTAILLLENTLEDTISIADTMWIVRDGKVSVSFTKEELITKRNRDIMELL